MGSTTLGMEEFGLIASIRGVEWIEIRAVRFVVVRLVNEPILLPQTRMGEPAASFERSWLDGAKTRHETLRDIEGTVSSLCIPEALTLAHMAVADLRAVAA